jgi:ribonuclease D
MIGDKLCREVTMRNHDMAYADCTKAANFNAVALDTETSGLNWKTERIALCQLSFPDDSVTVVRINENIPQLLCDLLTNDSIKKVFHHAVFDLRFMVYHWRVSPKNIACTKIASKLLNPSGTHGHGLRDLLWRHLNVSINKDEQVSDWFADQLSESQIAYAARDVVYLLSLLKSLELKLNEKGLLGLAHACFDHIPARVRLDILGYEDPYGY